MKLSSKEIFTFLGCVLSIFIVAFLVIKLSLPKKIKEAIENIKENDKTSEKEENNGSSSNGKDEEEEVVIPNYISSEEAISIGKDLYSKAEIISFDPLSYSGFIFRKSDNSSYDTKIINYSAEVSSIFYDINSLLSSDTFFDGNNLYLKNNIKVKDYTFVSTDLMLTNIEEKKITFTARSTYCERNNDRCSSDEVIMYSTKTDREFIIEKISDKWIITKFERAY